jgi:formiminoglutamase
VLKPCDQNIWQGRTDRGEHNRWHERINQQSKDGDSALAICGFCSDAGVSRNQGRLGASLGPDVIRAMLANLVYSNAKPVVDRGNISYEDDQLELGQTDLATIISKDISHKNFPIVLGGGHEVAWASYQGIRNVYPDTKLGIINFDAHFDLRPSQPHGSSGTPFRQIAENCQETGQSFNYFVMGINKAVNTPSLFSYAKSVGVRWLSDIDMGSLPVSHLLAELEQFCGEVDKIYVSICLDVFPAHIAPGVSAPASLGVDSIIIIQLLHYLKNLGSKIVMLDVAEMNPMYDIDSRTARLAARLIQEFVSE